MVVAQCLLAGTNVVTSENFKTIDHDLLNRWTEEGIGQGRPEFENASIPFVLRVDEAVRRRIEEVRTVKPESCTKRWAIGVWRPENAEERHPGRAQARTAAVHGPARGRRNAQRGQGAEQEDPGGARQGIEGLHRRHRPWRREYLKGGKPETGHVGAYIILLNQMEFCMFSGRTIRDSAREEETP